MQNVYNNYIIMLCKINFDNREEFLHGGGGGEVRVGIPPNQQINVYGISLLVLLSL